MPNATARALQEASTSHFRRVTATTIACSVFLLLFFYFSRVLTLDVLSFLLWEENGTFLAPKIEDAQNKH